MIAADVMTREVITIDVRSQLAHAVVGQHLRRAALVPAGVRSQCVVRRRGAAHVDDPTDRDHGLKRAVDLA